MLAHARGARTSVVCLTDGRAASNRGGARNADQLAQQRREEFAAALSVLEVDEGEVLGYSDGDLAGAGLREVVCQIVVRMRRFRPQVVLTFGGDGGVNQHPDHTAASLFATAAFHWAGREMRDCPQAAPARFGPYRPQKLYYSATTFLADPLSRQARDISLVPASLILELGDLKARKFEAFARHQTQAAVLSKVREVFEEHAGQERYLLAAARGLRSSPLEQDLFEGVEED